MNSKLLFNAVTKNRNNDSIRLRNESKVHRYYQCRYRIIVLLKFAIYIFFLVYY